jgi:phosphotransferase system HPr (HPr) family protein
MTHTQSSLHGQILITDPLGLHLRPAAKLAILAKSFRSDIRVLCQGATADAKSLLDLVVLAAGCGTTLDIVAHGLDAEQAVAALSKLLSGSVTHGAAA